MKNYMCLAPPWAQALPQPPPAARTYTGWIRRRCQHTVKAGGSWGRRKCRMQNAGCRMFTTICCPPWGGGKNESGESRQEADTAAEQWHSKKRAVPHSLCRPD